MKLGQNIVGRAEHPTDNDHDALMALVAELRRILVADDSIFTSIDRRLADIETKLTRLTIDVKSSISRR